MDDNDLAPLYDIIREMTSRFNWGAQEGTEALPSWNKSKFHYSQMYSYFHHRIENSAGGLHLIHDVLDSTTDADRVHYCENYCDLVLGITDCSDATWFRRGVYKKEAARETKYSKHRDHAVHTLHNYILGWFFFENSKVIRSSLLEHFKIRGLDFSEKHSADRFGEVWCFTSLLHDIGYIFEGELEEEGTTDLWDNGVRYGAEIVCQYFNDVFWTEIEVLSATEKDILRRETTIDKDPLSVGDPHTLSDTLRNVGDLSSILEEIFGRGSKEFKNLNHCIDGFDLWKQNYLKFDNAEMKDRIEGLEKSFHQYLNNGIPGTSIKVLDHGVAGGLLLLKYSTIWFRTYYDLKLNLEGNDPVIRSIKQRIWDNLNNGAGVYSATHWWDSIVWATASVAMHNVQQNQKSESHLGPLKLNEDPLTYLGILVDLLQEWDRHPVNTLAALDHGKRSINGKDVRIGVNELGKVEIVFGVRANDDAASRKNRLEEELDEALAGWRDFLTVNFKEVRTA